MIKIEFNGIKLSIPQQWSELTLAQYELLTNSNKDDTSAWLQMLSEICCIDVDKLLNMPREALKAISASLQFITETEVEPSNEIVIHGVEYRVAQSDHLTLAEWVDIDTIMSSNRINKFAEILSIICRPIGETYNAEVSAGRQQMFASLTCDKALGPVSFFLSRKKKSDEILSHCFKVVAQANQFVKDTEHFARNGDGIKQLPIWQKIKYIFLMRYLKKQLSKFSVFCSTK